MTDKILKRRYYSMKSRCYSENLNPKVAIYYRDKGIKVCDEWLRSFDAFKEWALSNGYDDGLTLDRIDPDGDYEPSNCRWVSSKENTIHAVSLNAKRFYVVSGKYDIELHKWVADSVVSDDPMTYEDAQNLARKKIRELSNFYYEVSPHPRLGIRFDYYRVSNTKRLDWALARFSSV